MVASRIRRCKCRGLCRRAVRGLFDTQKNLAQRDDGIEMPSEEEEAICAMVMGVRDYAHIPTAFKKMPVLSGGVDSALVLAVAVDALGAENVHAIMMPTRYTAQMSLDDAKDMAQRAPVCATMCGDCTTCLICTRRCSRRYLMANQPMRPRKQDKRVSAA